MSHVKAINDYKAELLLSGITEPDVQSALVRTAYISVFIQLIERYSIPKEDQKDVMFHILNKWNEIFPVNGNIVFGQVNSFYTRLKAEIANGGNVFVQLSTDSQVTDHPTYTDFESYKELMVVLYGEAEHMYKKIQKV